MRLFFALWPDASTREALVSVRDVLHGMHGGRAMHPETLHLTLAFLGEVAPGRLAEILNVGVGVQAQRFSVVFDQAACWRGNRIAHLEAGTVPSALLDLVTQLDAGLASAHLPFDRRAYLPHITLIRNADCTKESPAVPPVTWSARDFVLVRSSPRPGGARYEQLGCWPLL